MRRLAAITPVSLSALFDFCQGLKQCHAAERLHAAGCSTATPGCDNAGSSFDVTKNLEQKCR